MLEIRTLGGLQLTDRGKSIIKLTSKKAEALLVYLAVTGRPHSREMLANLLWDDRPQNQAMANLRTILSSLRKNVGDYVEISREFAKIQSEADIWLDLNEFQEEISAANLQKAVSLYQGEFLEGFFVRESTGFEDWLSNERLRCRQKLQSSLHDWVRYHVERGSYQEGIGYVEQLLVIDPCDEEAIRQLMTLLTLSGQQASATKRYIEFTEVLSDELGVDPSPQTLETHQKILGGSVGPSEFGMEKERESIRGVGECPYRGLAPFREIDAPFFYGRENFSRQMTDTVLEKRAITILIGASGSGKSSVVFAGLFPELRKRSNWQQIVMRPGAYPFENCAAAILNVQKPDLSEFEKLAEIQKLAFRFENEPGLLWDSLRNLLEEDEICDHLLLVIDQFEELFTLCPDKSIQRKFLAELLKIERSENAENDFSIRNLNTLRADFVGQALEYRPLADVMQNAALMLGPMTRGELRSVIVKPAEKQGARFEPGLVERILNDIGDEPGNLPLLEFSLTLLWDRMDQGWITHDGYEETGHVSGALTRYAEEVMDSLDEFQKDQIRRIFIQLVQPGENAEDTRRIAIKAELAGCDWSLVQLLADKRLVVTNMDEEGQETVEVIHEALIHNWGRLRKWMEEDQAFRSWQEGLRVNIRQWADSREDEGSLLRGRSLTEAENWLVERPNEVSSGEIAFIEASIKLRDRKELERAKLRRRIYAGLTIGLLVALVLSAFALYQRNQSEEAYSLSLAANVQNALDNNENDLALALALAAVETGNTPPALERALREAAFAPGPIREFHITETFGQDEMPFSMDVSPTEMVSLIGFRDGTIILWDIESGEEIRRLVGHTDVVADVVFSADGKTALSGSYDTTVIYWDLNTGEVLSTFEGHTGWVRTVAFSPDGTQAASGSFVGTNSVDIVNPGELIMWNLQTAEEISRFEGHPSGVQDVVFSLDGSQLLASSGMFTAEPNSQSLYLWDIDTKTVIHTFSFEADAYDLSFSKDGTRAYSAGLYTIEVWDLSNGRLENSFSGHDGMPRSIDFTRSEDKVISIDSVGQVILWNTRDGAIDFQLKLHTHSLGDWSYPDSPMPRVKLSYDEKFAVSIADDLRMIIWDLDYAGEIRTYEGHQSMIGGISMTPDGKYALTGSGDVCFCYKEGTDTSVRFWDIASGEQIQKLEGHTMYVTMTDMTPDGKTGISSSADGSVIVWDLVEGTQIRKIEEAHPGGTFTAMISPDGKYALTGSVTGSSHPDHDGTKLWDLDTGNMLFHFFSQDDNTTQVKFLPDGRSAYISLNGLSKIDLITGEMFNPVVPLEYCEVGFDISSDLETAYCATNGDTILRSFDMKTGKMLIEYGAHGGNRTRVKISDDDQVLLSSSGWGDLYLWERETGELIRTWNSGYGQLDIDISADGRLALTPGMLGDLILWDMALPVEVDDLLAWIAENRIVRELSCEERLNYTIEPLCEGGE